MKGTVIRMDLNRGFGFIRGEDKLSRFFHCKEVKGTLFDLLSEGDEVLFTPATDGTENNKLRAIEVQRVE
jgi:cold shock CspA family protein